MLKRQGQAFEIAELVEGLDFVIFPSEQDGMLNRFGSGRLGAAVAGQQRTVRTI
ncbi:MAG: hypothetical protein JO002_04210 [Burkholderiaceae bacterium]|nr:hypothetical protein [Burkholderiaceae bacterium]